MNNESKYSHAKPHWREYAEFANRSSKKTAGISALIGLVLIVIAAFIANAWRNDLPNYLAAHWDATGTPTRSTSFGGYIAPWIIMGLVTLGLFTVVGRALGNQAMYRKWIAAMNVWTGLFCGTYLLTGLWFQRGVGDYPRAPLTTITVGLPLIVSILGLALTWVIIPGDPPMPTTIPIPNDAARIVLPSQQRAVWHRRISGRKVLIIGTIGTLVILAMAYWLWNWALLLTAILLMLLYFTMLAFSVRVDSGGLTVRSFLGWPRTHIPLNEVVRASVTTVNPVGDFGGWGWRAGLGGNRIGVITRNGKALQVERTGGRYFVITTDDADGAAALLNTFADLTRSPSETV